jgi:hypothetical protein
VCVAVCTQAEELIMARLEVEPTANLYCSLGDVKRDVKHYHTAWEFSKQRSARAMRSVGRCQPTISPERHQPCVHGRAFVHGVVEEEGSLRNHRCITL